MDATKAVILNNKVSAALIKKRDYLYEASTSCRNFITINNVTRYSEFLSWFPAFSGTSNMPVPSNQLKAQSHNVHGKGSELLYSQTQMRTMMPIHIFAIFFHNFRGLKWIPL